MTFGLVRAKRIGGEEIAGHRPGTRTRSAADLAIVATATLSFGIGDIAEGHEQIAAAVDVAEGAVAEIAGALRNELARPHIAGVGHVHEAVRPVLHRVPLVPREIGPLETLLQFALEPETPVMRSLDDANGECLAIANLIEPRENALHFLRGQHLDLLRCSDRHQEIGVPARDAERANPLD